MARRPALQQGFELSQRGDAPVLQQVVQRGEFVVHQVKQVNAAGLGPRVDGRYFQQFGVGAGRVTVRVGNAWRRRRFEVRRRGVARPVADFGEVDAIRGLARGVLPQAVFVLAGGQVNAVGGELGEVAQDDAGAFSLVVSASSISSGSEQRV